MTLITKCLLFAFISSTFFCASAGAQTINAASCSEKDVTAALTAAQTGSSAPVVVIPSCPSGVNWTTPFYYNAPANLTIQGQTVCTGSGNPSSNNLTCTDSTVLIDDINRCDGDPPMLGITTNASGTFRMTGVTIGWGSAGCFTSNGSLRFGGTSQKLRVDHMHFDHIPLAFSHSGNLEGVFDHIILDGSSGSGWRDYGDINTNGDSDWANPTDLGGGNFVFLEDNTFNTAGNDCQQGGRWVVRYNTFNNNGVQTHPTGGAGRARGCRAWEVYENSFVNPTTNNFNVFFLSSGTGVIWGNSAPTGIANFVTLHSMRRSNSTYTQQATPSGWGYCGTSFTGVGSNWDQNTNSITGYRCMDQPGQGKGDLLTGNFPNVKNTATGCIASSPCAGPRQASEPIYEWLNVWGKGSGSFWANQNPESMFPNVDYYLYTASFSGTSGVGTGLLSQRPANCAVQVGYWATDVQTLYLCKSTNTWSASYTPYTYPHPLTQGSGSASGPPAPSGLTATVSPSF